MAPTTILNLAIVVELVCHFKGLTIQEMNATNRIYTVDLVQNDSCLKIFILR